MGKIASTSMLYIFHGSAEITKWNCSWAAKMKSTKTFNPIQQVQELCLVVLLQVWLPVGSVWFHNWKGKQIQRGSLLESIIIIRHGYPSYAINVTTRCGHIRIIKVCLLKLPTLSSGSHTLKATRYIGFLLLLGSLEEKQTFAPFLHFVHCSFYPLESSHRHRVQISRINF